jgi:hypothetical protein
MRVPWRFSRYPIAKPASCRLRAGHPRSRVLPCYWAENTGLPLRDSFVPSAITLPGQGQELFEVLLFHRFLLAFPAMRSRLCPVCNRKEQVRPSGLKGFSRAGTTSLVVPARVSAGGTGRRTGICGVVRPRMTPLKVARTAPRTVPILANCRTRRRPKPRSADSHVRELASDPASARTKLSVLRKSLRFAAARIHRGQLQTPPGRRRSGW